MLSQAHLPSEVNLNSHMVSDVMVFSGEGAYTSLEQRFVVATYGELTELALYMCLLLAFSSIISRSKIA